MSTKCGVIVPCFGLTKDPLDGNYMLVMNLMDINLRKYLQQNHNKLTWKEKIQITDDIIYTFLKFIKRIRFIEIYILEIYYFIKLIKSFLLVILDFVDLLTNH